ncbi:hypothetical protein OIO90_005283 [Microbotryomycetes sp. JL221]|nr:hypothetical protein OIO90_005283 [Microbotryomycetes sp. JL221]
MSSPALSTSRSSSSFGMMDDEDEEQEDQILSSADGTRPSLTPIVAVEYLERLVNVELQAAGYLTADKEALEQLQGMTVVFFEALVQRAHELTEQANRTRVNLKDALEASVETGIVAYPAQMIRFAKQTRDRNDQVDVPPIRYKRVRPPVIEKTLPSDNEQDEEDDDSNLVRSNGKGDQSASLPDLHQSIIPKVKPRKLPEALKASFLPPLPPKHTFKQTPVYPQPAPPPLIPQPTFDPIQKPSKEAMRHLATLRARFNDSQLVSSSLRNLIRKTSVRTVGSSTMTTISKTFDTETVEQVLPAVVVLDSVPEKDVTSAAGSGPPTTMTAVSGGESASQASVIDGSVVKNTDDMTMEQESTDIKLTEPAATTTGDVSSSTIEVTQDVSSAAPGSAQPAQASELEPTQPTSSDMVADSSAEAAAAAAASLEEEWTDIVDYEGDWYGGATSRRRPRHSSSNVTHDGSLNDNKVGGVIVVRVNKSGMIDKQDLEASGFGSITTTLDSVAFNAGGESDKTGSDTHASGGLRLGTAGWADAGRVGVASKRRKWRA